MNPDCECIFVYKNKWIYCGNLLLPSLSIISLELFSGSFVHSIFLSTPHFSLFDIHFSSMCRPIWFHWCVRPFSSTTILSPIGFVGQLLLLLRQLIQNRLHFKAMTKYYGQHAHTHTQQHMHIGVNETMNRTIEQIELSSPPHRKRFQQSLHFNGRVNHSEARKKENRKKRQQKQPSW